jgi:hypothetical protein
MAGPNLGIGDSQNSPFGERMCITAQEDAANQGAAPRRSTRARHSMEVPEEIRKNKEEKRFLTRMGSGAK